MSAASARRDARPPVPMTLVVTLVPLAAAIDVVGGYVAGLTRLPVFLDTIGTCVAAIVLGPWWGALAGVLANLVGSINYGASNIPFALVSVASALVWGYGARQLRLAATGARFLGLNLLVAVVASAVATPVVIALFGAATGHPSDLVTAALLEAGLDGVPAVFTSNVIVVIPDRVLSGFAALAIVAALPASLTAGVRLPAGTPRHWVLVTATGAAVGVVLLAVYVLFLWRPG